MITLNISWHLLLYIICMLIAPIWAICENYGSHNISDWPLYLLLVVLPIDVIITLIYGGFVWW